jgi:hypothetical protein
LTDNDERREHPRIKAKWPVTIITDRTTIEGEAINITFSGLFVRCKERLQENEICQLILRIPGRDPIIVKGNMIWSNLDGAEMKDHLSGMGFSFFKITEEDLEFFKEMISGTLENDEK